MRPFVTLRGVRMYLYEHEAVSDAIRRAGDFYEAAILDDVAARLPDQRTIVDVGANIGNHSLYWAAFVQPALVLAIEPVRANFALLRANTHGYACVRPVRAALSDRVGTARMTLDTINMGRSRFDPAGDVVVATQRLDDYRLNDVTLIKVDVEGHQAAVLAGAALTIERCRPALLIEGSADIPPGYSLARSYPGDNHLWTS